MLPPAFRELHRVMDDQPDNLPPPPPAPQPQETKPDAALLETVRINLTARGQKTREIVVMAYPDDLFAAVLERLVNRAVKIEDTLDWLEDECTERELACPSRSAFYRFAAMVREEFRLAQLADRRRAAEGYVKAYTEGDSNAQVAALNTRFTELLTDCLLQMDSLDQVDSDRLFALTGAAKSVAQVTYGKQMMDARIAALSKQVEERDANIRLKDQQLAERDLKLKAEAEKRAKAIAAAEKAAAKGDSGEAVSKAVKEALGL